MTIDTAKVIRILDAEQGKVSVETLTTPKVDIDEAVIPYPRDRRGRLTVDHENVALLETGAELNTYNFPDALRQGIQFDAFTSYSELPVTYPQWARVVNSTKQQEEYLRDSAVGLPPIVQEGQPYPEVATDFDGGTIIRNYKRGFIMSVTEEMQRFDQIGKVRETAEIMGRAHRRGEEQAAMDVITTTGNYTRNSTTGDNDVGANQVDTDFNGAGLITAFTTLRTSKDRKTSVYLGCVPDTLIIGPLLEWAVMQLIRSPQTMRVGDSGSASEVYGGGTNNPFYNSVRTIIVSPEFSSSYAWAMMESKRAVTFQRVDPISVLIEGQNASTTGYFERDVIRYRVRNWYGIGMRDDRFAFYSPNTTAPTVS